jgi:hypothetical protein
MLLKGETKHMGNIDKEPQKAVVLWLSGVRLADICTLVEVENLMKQGILVELQPSPITGPQTQHYQVFGGRLPAHFGFFDTLMPLCRLPRFEQGANGYTIVEEYSGRDAPSKMLPDLLAAAGWTVDYEEGSLTELPDSLRRLIQSSRAEATCKIIKCTVRTVSAAHSSVIEEALHVARSWVGETGLLALLSDIQPATVERFVNINNFLAEMSVIERNEQTGQINWSNSLAYFAGHGQLWVNLLGRDSQGAVHPQDEYEEVCETLVKALPAKLLDSETKAQVIERVYRKEEFYSSEYLFCAPDLTVVFKPGYAPSPQSTRLGFDQEVFTTPGTGTKAMAGVHPSLVSGFLLASAPALVSGLSEHEPAPLTSVVPTLLHALGVKYANMDSPALGALFAPSYLETHPIPTDVQSHGLSEEDEELVINRLRDLGYV